MHVVSVGTITQGSSYGIGDHPDQPMDPQARNGFAWLLLLMFSANVMLSISLVTWQIASIPVRSVFAIGCVGLVAMFRWELITQSIMNHRIKHIIIALAAIFGAVSSMLSGEIPAVMGRQLLEIHVQCFVAMILGGVMVSVWGVRRVTFVLLGCIGVTSLVALMQYVNIGPAWDIRATLGSIQGDPPTTQVWYTRHFRALGVSLSPVIYATQICLGFAAYWMYRAHQTRGLSLVRLDFAIVFAFILFVVLSIISGNRSPLLGGVFFIMVYVLSRDARVALLCVAGGLIALPMMLFFMASLEQSGLRVANTSDGSALGRFTLGSYGIRLFLNQPMGYGLGFNPRDHWPEHWEFLQHMANAQAIRHYGLHNFFLNSLNKYGLPIIFVATFTAYHMLQEVARDDPVPYLHCARLLSQ